MLLGVACADPVAPRCEDLPGAPAPLSIDGARAATVDVLTLDAALSFDLDAQVATATATLTFRVGSDEAYPLFDLRQSIAHAELDGQPLAPHELARVSTPGGEGAEMWVVTRTLEACSEHTLTLEYTIEAPPSAPAAGPTWAAAGLYWTSGFSEAEPGRLLEMWLPVGLMHDAFDFGVDVALAGAGAADHILLSGSSAEPRGPTSWRLQQTGATSASPLVVVAPRAWVTSSPELGHGLRAHLIAETPPSPDALEAFSEVARAAMDDLVARYGPPPSAATTLIWDATAPRAYAGMEYDGGAIVRDVAPALVQHELMHLWFGRGGLRPLTSRDGWVDEAWVTFKTAVTPPAPFPADLSVPGAGGPLALGDPWARALAPWAYHDGARLFATLDAWHPGRLDEVMRAFATAAGQTLTTEQLVVELSCALEDPRVLVLFTAKLTDLGPLPAPCDGFHSRPAAE